MSAETECDLRWVRRKERAPAEGMPGVRRGLVAPRQCPHALSTPPLRIGVGTCPLGGRRAITQSPASASSRSISASISWQ